MDNFYDLFMVSPLLLVVLFFCRRTGRIYRFYRRGGGLPSLHPCADGRRRRQTRWRPINYRMRVSSSSLYFIQAASGNPAEQKLNILMFIGFPMSGALLVQQHVQAIFAPDLPFIPGDFIGLLFLLMPKLGEEDRQRRLYDYRSR